MGLGLEPDPQVVDFSSLGELRLSNVFGFKWLLIDTRKRDKFPKGCNETYLNGLTEGRALWVLPD